MTFAPVAVILCEQVLIVMIKNLNFQTFKVYNFMYLPKPSLLNNSQNACTCVCGIFKL